MKSKKYWERRSGKRLLSTLKDADKAIDRLNGDYERSLANIRGEIEKLYGKFADEHGMDVNAVQERMKKIDYDTWQKRMKAYQNDMGDGKQALSFELELFLLSNRITYLQAIEAEIVANMAVLAHRQDKEALELLSKSLKSNYYETMYDHYKDKDPRVLSLMDRHSVAISKESVQTALLYPWSGANYSERIWKREYNISHKVRELVTRNILEGKNIESLSTLLANELGKDKKYAAKTLLHTEAAYIKAQADLLVYQKMGIKEYEYLATLDEKTCPVCRQLDGQHFLVSEAIQGVNYPPMHPNTRSTTIHYDPESKKGKTRTARDKYGRIIEVPADLTYKQWYKTYVEGDPEYLTKEKAWKNRHSDRKQYEDYIDAIGKKNVPSSFDKFQDLKYNNIKEWEQLKHYKRSITSGELTSFADFKLYKDTSFKIDESLIGITILDELEMLNKSNHFINRVIGSVEQKRNGVSVEDCLRIVQEPDQVRKTSSRSIKITKYGVGTVSVNPKTKNYIQVNPDKRGKND